MCAFSCSKNPVPRSTLAPPGFLHRFTVTASTEPLVFTSARTSAPAEFAATRECGSWNVVLNDPDLVRGDPLAAGSALATAIDGAIHPAGGVVAIDHFQIEAPAVATYLLLQR